MDPPALPAKSSRKVPEWAKKVPALAELLVVQTHEGEFLFRKEDESADPHFLAKGVLLWTLHIHFTYFYGASGSSTLCLRGRRC